MCIELSGFESCTSLVFLIIKQKNKKKKEVFSRFPFLGDLSLNWLLLKDTIIWKGKREKRCIEHREIRNLPQDSIQIHPIGFLWRRGNASFLQLNSFLRGVRLVVLLHIFYLPSPLTSPGSTLWSRSNALGYWCVWSHRSCKGCPRGYSWNQGLCDVLVSISIEILWLFSDEIVTQMKYLWDSISILPTALPFFVFWCNSVDGFDLVYHSTLLWLV